MQTIVQPTPLSGESIQDIVASLLVAGANVTLTYDDVANTLTIAAVSGTSYTNEEAQDAVGNILTDSATVNFTYNDAVPSITADFIGSSGPTTEDIQDTIGGILVDSATVNFTYNDSVPSISADVIGLGSMATQDANAVAITGGTAVLSDLDVDGTTLRIDNTNHRVGIKNATPFVALDVIGDLCASKIGVGGFATYPLDVTGNVRVMGKVGIQALPNAARALSIAYTTITQYGVEITPSGDTSTGAIIFNNAASAVVGAITTTATATAYTTSSDVRLKHAIEKLVGSLDRIRLLNPVHYLWNTNNEPGEGFLAHELQQVIPAAVTGEPNAINNDGSILPQGVDNSKIVPHIVAAMQELIAQIQTLTSRIVELEGAANAT